MIYHVTFGRSCGRWDLGAQAVTELKLELDDWWTVRQVAEVFGIQDRQVVAMIRCGRLRAEKKGWQYLVHKSWVPRSWPPKVKR